MNLGIYGQGSSVSTSDFNAGLAELNDMWSGWSADEGLIPAVQIVPLSFTANVNPTSLGVDALSGAPYTRVYQVVFYGSGISGRRALTPVDHDTYFKHTDLVAASGIAPEQVYIDFNETSAGVAAKVYVWPVPSIAGTLEVEVPSSFVAWDAATAHTLSAPFQDAVTWALAWRLISQYGEIVSPQTQARVAELSAKSEDRIRQMNIANRRLTPPMAANPAQQQAVAVPQR